MDIFEKCRKFYHDSDYARSLGYPANPRMAKALGLYPFFIPLEANDGTVVTIDSRKYIMIGSNNYLGLTNHPAIKEAAKKTIEKYGSACTGSRFLNGTLDLHLELEERLAKFVDKECALVFSTGYQANLGTISALLDKDSAVFLDKEDHASIFDAVSLTRFYKHYDVSFFRHNDVASLRATLAATRPDKQKLVIVDGVFSMGGDIAPLPEIAGVCREFGARLMVDDAHSIGVLGGGHGTSEHFRCTHEVDLIMGTFSKALASVGGFVAGEKEVINWVQHVARPFMFSASLPPSNVAAVIAALDIIEREPERVESVNIISARVRNGLRSMGYNIGSSRTPVVPVIIGDQFRTMQTWELLFRNGIYTNVALPPAVAPNRSLLRTSYMATHTAEQIDRVLDEFNRLRSVVRMGD